MAIGNYRGCLAIAGGITVHLTIGTLYTFGNMSPYVTSYIRERSEPSDLRYQDTNIIYALMICGQATMMPLSSVFFAKKLGARFTTLLGGWLASLGMLLSYVAIQSSFYALVITYGLMFGAGVGIAYIPPLICAMKWLPKKKGLASGLIVAGFGGGSFIFNMVQTVYINPENVSLNVSVPEHPDEKYFDEAEVLDNVPSSFLVLGITYAVMQLLGVMLLSEPSEHNKQEIQLSGSDSETDRLLKNEDRQRQGESYYSEKEKTIEQQG